MSAKSEPNKPEQAQVWPACGSDLEQTTSAIMQYVGRYDCPMHQAPLLNATCSNAIISSGHTQCWYLMCRALIYHPLF